MQTIRTNLENMASTQYTNHDFTRMCVCKGKILGAGPGGLFRIGCSDSDNGTPIDAYFIPVSTNFGEINTKRLPFINFLGRCDGNLSYEVTGDDETTIGPYLAIANTSKGTQRIRTKGGRGMEFFYVSIKVSNVDGAFFAVDSIQVALSSEKRGIK